MSKIDREYFAWERKTFGTDTIPEWKVCKGLYAEHLLATKSKSEIWKMLCGPAKGPCRCNCMCAAGIAWNALLSKQPAQCGNQ